MSETQLRCIIATQMRERGFSGPQTHVAAVREYAESNGWGVVVVTPFSGRALFRIPLFALRKLVQIFSSELDIFWYHFWHDIYLRKALSAAIRADEGPTIIYANDTYCARAALNLRRPALDKVVMVVHSNESQAHEWAFRGKIRKNGWVYRKIRSLEEKVFPQVDKLIFVSDWSRMVVQQRIPAVQRVRTAVVHNFVKVPAPAPGAQPGDMISIGSLEPIKNQKYILRVVGELKRRGRCYTLTVIGGGEDSQKLKMLAQELGIEPQVRFLGAVSRASGYIHAHRLLVHSAFAESCGIALIEALAAGTPVVAGRVGGIPEVITAETGAFWDLSSIANGADTVESLLDFPEKLSAAGQKAQERYREHFTPEVCGGQLLCEWTQLLTTPI